MTNANLLRERLFRAIGRKVSAVRRSQPKELSQTELAERIGLSRAAVSALEGGHQGISVVTLCRLALALDIEPATLLPAKAELEWLRKEPGDMPAERLVKEYLSRHA